MKIVKFDKNSPEWLEFKRTKIGGSRSKASKPLTRGEDRTPELFWTLVGEALTNPSDDKASMKRGHSLEAEGIRRLSEMVGLEFDDNPGVWVSDDDESLILSPDGAQPGDKPTYSAEIKSLGEGKHFKYLYKIRHHEGKAIDAVPDESKAAFKEQCVQYFTVNPDLLVHFFGLYNPDAIHEDQQIVVLKIERHEVIDLVNDQLTSQLQLIKQVKTVIDDLVGDKF